MNYKSPHKPAFIDSRGMMVTIDWEKKLHCLILIFTEFLRSFLASSNSLTPPPPKSRNNEIFIITQKSTWKSAPSENVNIFSRKHFRPQRLSGSPKTKSHLHWTHFHSQRQPTATKSLKLKNVLSGEESVRHNTRLRLTLRCRRKKTSYKIARLIVGNESSARKNE